MTNVYVVEGKLVVLSSDKAELLHAKIASDSEIALFFRSSLQQPDLISNPPPAKPLTSHHGRRPCGCQQIVVQSWLGVEWIGTPWPRRLRLRSPITIAKYPGCGCIARLVDLADAIKRAIRWAQSQIINRANRSQRQSEGPRPE